MKRFILILAILFVPMVSGCATTSQSTYGRDFNESAKDKIVKNSTTKDELISLLGQPHDKGIDENNREWWVYIYQEGTYKYNAFDGLRGKVDNETRTKKLLVSFENDTVKNFVYSDNTMPGTMKW